MLQTQIQDIESVKRKIMGELTAISSRNPMIFADWLIKTDFFEAPASTKHHYNEPGGLAAHSWNVFTMLKANNDLLGNMYPEDTIRICGLLHDICKIDYYAIDTDPPTTAQLNYLKTLAGRAYHDVPQAHMTKGYVSELINYYKNGGETKPEFKFTYKVQDKFPIGHGEKSVILIASRMEITVPEALAVRWHMLAFDAGIHFSYPSGYPFKQAMNDHPLVTMLAAADLAASNILESDKDIDTGVLSSE